MDQCRDEDTILYCRECGDEIPTPSMFEIINFLYTHRGTGHTVCID